jgi:crossover junction endodeoxyribonuclease RusA
MPNVLKLTLPEPPSANRWWRKFRNRMVLSAEARAYKTLVWGYVMEHRGRPAGECGSVAVSIDWYRGRKAGDLDKRIGVLLDALQGLAYDNDSQVVELTARRFDDKQNPRVEVTIREVA